MAGKRSRAKEKVSKPSRSAKPARLEKNPGNGAICLVLNSSRKKSARFPLEIADSELSRTRGLMFRGKVVPILFVFSSPGVYPIHSFFVPGVFDAVYLSGKGEVVEMFLGIAPGRPLICPKKNAAYLLELPPNLTFRLGIKTGDILEWRWNSKNG